MNRNYTLIISAVLVVVLLAVWLYLMFFANSDGEPEVIEGSGEFAQFDDLGEDSDTNNGLGVGGNSQGQFGSPENGVPGDEGFEWPILRQLTTRNVIGYQEIEKASSTKVVFMESGVGHIYEIDLDTGEEKRVSATTIPDAREAVFSADGSSVAVKTGESTGINPLLYGEINYDEKSIDTGLIAEQVSEFTISESGVVLFGSVTNSSIMAKTYNPATETFGNLFSTPFREATLLFGSTLDSKHYFYPKTSHILEGFIYQVEGSTLTRLGLDGFGFTANNLDNLLVATYRNQNDLVSEQLSTATNQASNLEFAVIPSKCVGEDGSLYCAIPNNKNLQHDSITNWLMGTQLFYDDLWVISSSSEELIGINEFSGRNVDVINGALGDISSDWYFQNKLDNSLWLYELSRLNSESEETI